jgi:hypothetical protein
MSLWARRQKKAGETSEMVVGKGYMENSHVLANGSWPTKEKAIFFRQYLAIRNRAFQRGSMNSLWKVVSVTTGMFVVRPATRGVTDVLAILPVAISHFSHIYRPKAYFYSRVSRPSVCRSPQIGCNCHRMHLYRSLGLDVFSSTSRNVLQSSVLV